MSEQKRFKAFRSELNESEYKETLTGYPNRGIDTDVGPANANLLTKVNAVLNSLNRFTHQHANDALVKIRTRLNLFMLDFPWTPWMWQSNMTGTFAVPVTLFGRVDGTSGMAGAGGIRFDGKASPDAGLQEFTLSVTVETAEDGLYRVTAKLAPRVEVVPEGVEEDGDAVTEDYQTDARETEMKKKIAKHDDVAQRAYQRRMTGTPKQARRAGKVEGKHDKAITRLLKQDEKEQNSPRTYGRGGKLIKRGSRAEVKEEVEAIDELLTPMRDRITSRALDKATADYNNPNLSAAQQKKAGARASRATYARLRARSHDGTVAGKSQTPKFKRENEKWRKVEKSVKEGVEAIDEMHKPGDTVKVPHKGKMVRGKIVRHDKGGSSKAAQHGGGYVVDVGEYSSITVPHHKIVKEGVEQIDELSKATKDAYVAKRGSQLSSMLSGHKHSKQLTGKQQANAVKGIKQAMGVQEELVGGQKKLDVNKNKRLDAQDFALLRAKKKPVKEYTEFMPGIDLQVPAPTEARADKSGKSKRFHKGAMKSVEEAVAKGKKAKKPSPHQGAANVIAKQKSIKSMLQKHDMRW